MCCNASFLSSENLPKVDVVMVPQGSMLIYLRISLISDGLLCDSLEAEGTCESHFFGSLLFINFYLSFCIYCGLSSDVAFLLFHFFLYALAKSTLTLQSCSPLSLQSWLCYIRVNTILIRGNWNRITAVEEKSPITLNLITSLLHRTGFIGFTAQCHWARWGQLYL